MTWRSVGSVLPTELSQARLQLHWAAQLVSAPGTTLLPPQSGHRHTNLVWDCALDVLAGRPVGEASVRAALVFESLELALLDGTLERASLALPGITLQDALRWLSGHIAGSRTLALPEHEMPAHPVGHGVPFAAGGTDARTELAAWFANGAATVQDAVAREPAASPVRCWPHHFDVASLIALDPDRDDEQARTIGIGLSPGDDSYDQPYFYVTPWPYPEPSELPTLEAGARWRTEGWTGAVLTAEQIISERPGRQPRVVQEAVRDAMTACRTLLVG